jgi:hypothetical protein
MNLNDIRSDEKLVEWWSQICRTENYYKINKMMQDTHPLRFMDPGPVTPSSAEKRLGQIEGYELALERIRLCGEFIGPVFVPTAPTFEPPEIEETIHKTPV